MLATLRVSDQVRFPHIKAPHWRSERLQCSEKSLTADVLRLCSYPSFLVTRICFKPHNCVFVQLNVASLFLFFYLCRCETHPVCPGGREEHQRRRPQAGSGLGTGGLNSPYSAKGLGNIRRIWPYNVCPTQTSKGGYLGEWFKATATNLLVEHHLKVGASVIGLLTFIAFLFVVASV